MNKTRKKLLYVVFLTSIIVLGLFVLKQRIIRLDFNLKVYLSGQYIPCSSYVELPYRWSEYETYQVKTTNSMKVVIADSFNGFMRGEDISVNGNGRPCVFFVEEQSVKTGAYICFEESGGEVLKYKVIKLFETYYLIRLE